MWLQADAICCAVAACCGLAFNDPAAFAAGAATICGGCKLVIPKDHVGGMTCTRSGRINRPAYCSRMAGQGGAVKWQQRPMLHAARERRPLTSVSCEGALVDSPIQQRAERVGLVEGDRLRKRRDVRRRRLRRIRCRRIFCASCQAELRRTSVLLGMFLHFVLN